MNVGFEGTDLGKADGDGVVKSTTEGGSPGMGIQTMGALATCGTEESDLDEQGQGQGVMRLVCSAPSYVVCLPDRRCVG